MFQRAIMELREQIRPGPFLVGRLLCVLGVPVDKRLVTVSSPLFFAVTRQNTQSRGKLQQTSLILMRILKKLDKILCPHLIQF